MILLLPFELRLGVKYLSAIDGTSLKHLQQFQASQLVAQQEDMDTIHHTRADSHFTV